MPDDILPSDPPADELVLQAMLYASGELDAEQTAAFEQRLGEDQAARDALCKAVELTQGLPGQEQAPDPAYRARVRQRLRQRRRHRRALRDDNPFFGHPAFWSALGAAVAILFMVIISHLVASLIPPPTSPRTAPGTQSRSLSGQVGRPEDRAAALLDRLATATEAERPQLEAQLLEIARELVDQDVAALKDRADQLEKDLAAVHAELRKAADTAEERTKERYRALLDKRHKAKK
jgi:hypothetical protein